MLKQLASMLATHVISGFYVVTHDSGLLNHPTKFEIVQNLTLFIVAI